MKFKQVLAGLLVGTMVVTSAPVSGLGALSALAASEEAETKNYNYTKLTEGLTASADCANECCIKWKPRRLLAFSMGR